MIKRILLSVLAMSLLLPTAIAQTDAERGAMSDAIRNKSIKLDVYNQILPILLTKAQINKLLGPIEEARARVRETEKKEFAAMRAIEPKLDAALKDAAEKGLVPSAALLQEIFSTWTKLVQERMAMADLNADKLAEVFTSVADSGQRKTVANSLNVTKFAPGAKPEDWKESDRIQLFCKEILLHPLAYEVLREMAKKPD